MDKYTIAISALEAAFGRDTIAPQARLDLQISDIWNVYERITSAQDYYFVGSRGAGKTTIISKAIAVIQDENLLRVKRTLPYVVTCSTFLTPNKVVSGDTLKHILYHFFGSLIGQLKPLLNLERVAKISVIAAKTFEWLNDRDWNRKLDSLLKGQQEQSVPEDMARTSRVRLKLLSDVGTLRLSVLEAGIVTLGSVSFTPIKVGVEHEREKNETPFRSGRLTASTSDQRGEVDQQLAPMLNNLIRKIGKECKQAEVEKIIVFVDDLQFLPLPMQVEVVRTLRYIAGQLKSRGVIMALKLFSATDLAPDIADSLRLSRKELQPKNIESSLENIDAKRRALETLLVRILQVGLGFTERELQQLFPREVVDQILVLSGGHPRRFLQICSIVLDKTQGRFDDNLYNVIMLSAAETINDTRRNLAVQLGMDIEPHAEEYSAWYETVMDNLVQYATTVNSPFFLIPHSEMRNNRELEQWVNDTVAIGDLLEIADEKWVNSEAYRLLALNPATIYDKTGKSEFHVTYQDIVNLQIGARQIEYKPIPYLES